MKSLQTYLECGGEGCATPANTMGMGNPGQIDGETLTEPIEGTAKCIRQKEKKRKKKIKESLFDGDLVTSAPSVLKNIEKLSSDSIRNMPIDELIDIYDSIITTGKRYSSTEIEKRDVDLCKNVVIIYKKEQERQRHAVGKYASSKYIFLCGFNNHYGRMYSAAIDYVHGHYQWSWHNKWDDWGHCTWDGTVDLIEDWFDECEFIVLPVEVSKKIIDLLRDVIY